MKGAEIIARYRQQQANRESLEDIWTTIERYVAPYRGGFFKDTLDNPNSAEWRKPWVYDGTAVMASQNLASSLHSSLTSPSAQWFRFAFRDPELNMRSDFVKWLSDCGRLVYQTLQDSNFNIQVNETYQDLVNYGTAVLVEHDKPKADGRFAVNFNSVPLSKCFFETDAEGKIYTYFEVLYWTSIQIVNFFGIDEPNIAKEIMDNFTEEGADKTRKWPIVYCVYRRPNVKLKTSTAQVRPSRRPFGSKYILEMSGEQLGKESGFYEMPAFCPRWRKTADAPQYGNSPAMIALGDVLTLNRTVELNLAALEKALDPPTLTTSRGLVGDLDLSAGGLTTVRDIKDLVPFESRARFDVTYQELNRLRDNIEKYFFIPQLLLPPMQGTPATATEIQVRMAQLERLIGPTLGRLQTDLLEPVVVRTFHLLFRKGELPEQPAELAEYDNAADIIYTSPLARTQEASQAQAIERFMEVVMQVSQVNPEAADVPNWDKMLTEEALTLGVNPSLINSNKEMKKKRQERQQQQMQQQMLEQQAKQQQGGQPEEAAAPMSPEQMNAQVPQGGPA